ncbi:MAG: NAD(P)-dependent oxidoreductase [Chloroflexi bacterium]|nr:NAD(P)-dependent oxidoreductase [Chloroflexota bacterium]
MGEKVGFIGLGAMGKPMARRLLETGVDLVVYDKLTAPVEDLVTLGATAAAGPQALAKDSSVVMVIVRDEAQTNEVMLGDDGVLAVMKKGSVALLMSTISPALCKRVATEGAALGVHVLDTPVSGGTINAGLGNLTIMVGGDRAVFERCLPVLHKVATNIYHLGEIGAGESMKLINNMIFYSNARVAREGLDLASAAGIDRELARQVIGQSTGGSWAIEQWNTVTFSPVARALELKDMPLAKAMAEEFGMSVPILDICIRQMKSER